jgi:hypothetical protein
MESKLSRKRVSVAVIAIVIILSLAYTVVSVLSAGDGVVNDVDEPLEEYVEENDIPEGEE